MDKIVKMINEFEPNSDQEKQDKKVILKHIDNFDNILTRDNEFAHITSSGFIMNKSLDKTLMIFHNIYKNWGWTGGHADGNSDLLEVALIEAKEETGLKNIEFLSKEIASIDILHVPGHYKNGEYISVHLHLSLAFVFIANEEDEVKIKPDENSGVKWIEVDRLEEYCHEEIMIPVYKKLINFAKKNKAKE